MKLQDKKISRKFFQVRINKNKVLTETKTALLISLDNKGNKVWIPKSMVFPSHYTNFNTISLCEEFEYNGYSIENGEEKEDTITGKELVNFLEAVEVVKVDGDNNERTTKIRKHKK